MTITMDDVANLAGVSKATVSRIINGIPKSASPETISRVNKAIAELGYMPNAIAASLKTTHTKTVGLIIGDISNPFFGTVINGIETTLQKSGYSLILANSGYDQEATERLARVLVERQVDALIVAPCKESPHEYINTIIDRDIHFVMIDGFIEDENVDQVVVDNYDASFNAIQYLINLGHSRIAMINGPRNRPTSTLRLKGYLDALRKNDIKKNNEFIKEGDYQTNSGYEKLKELICLDPMPTALFVANNFMTMGALGAIHDTDLRVPEDISILGFDDMFWYTMTKPTISAISQPAYEIGKVSAERVLVRLRRKRQPTPERIILKTKLIIRESTAPPKK